MKELVSKSAVFVRIEFWAFSTLFVFLLFGYLTNGLDGSSAMNQTPYKLYFDRAHVPFYFYYHYFIPQLIRNILLFGSFLYLNFTLIPKLLIRQSFSRNMLLLIGIFLFAGLVFGITDTYLKAY